MLSCNHTAPALASRFIKNGYRDTLAFVDCGRLKRASKFLNSRGRANSRVGDFASPLALSWRQRRLSNLSCSQTKSSQNEKGLRLLALCVTSLRRTITSLLE